MHLSAALVRIPRQGRKPVTPPPSCFCPWGSTGRKEIETNLCVYTSYEAHSFTHSLVPGEFPFNEGGTSYIIIHGQPISVTD